MKEWARGDTLYAEDLNENFSDLTAQVNQILGGSVILSTGDTPPVIPIRNQFWFDTAGQQLYIYYYDGTSSQWVNVTNIGVGGTDSLSDAPIDGQQYVRKSGEWTPIVAYYGLGRNLLRNPLFAVNQRGFTVSNTPNVFTFDGWQQWSLNDAYTGYCVAAIDSDRDAVGSALMRQYSRVVFFGDSGSASFSNARSYIEDVSVLAGKTVTVSFYAKASSALQLGVCIEQIFGSGGSPSASVNGVGQAVTLGTSWSRYSLTFSVPGVDGKVFGNASPSYSQIMFWFSTGTGYTARSAIGVQSGTIDLWGLQVEYGSSATPLEARPTDEYMNKCMRYYSKSPTYTIGGAATAGGHAYTNFAFPVAMPVLPGGPILSVNVSGGSGYTAATVVNPSEKGFTLNVATNSTSYSANVTYTADANL